MRDLEQLTTTLHNLIKRHSQMANTKTQIHPSSDMAPQQTRLCTSPRLAPTNKPTHSPQVIPAIPPAQSPRVAPTLPPIQSTRVAPTIPPIQYPRVAPRLPPIQAPKVIRGTPQRPTPDPIATRTRSHYKVPETVPKEDPTEEGPAYRTRSRNTKQLDTALAITCHVTSQPGYARQLSGCKFSRSMLYAALAAIQPEANLDPLTTAYAVMDLVSGRKLNYRQLLKEPKYSK